VVGEIKVGVIIVAELTSMFEDLFGIGLVDEL